MKLCIEKCGKYFKQTNPAQKACPDCQKIRDKRQRKQYCKDNRKRLLAMATKNRKQLVEEGAPAKVEAYQPKPKPLLITDSEQRLIDRYCDSLQNETLQCKVYKRGSAEFEAVAAEILNNKYNAHIVEERLLTAPMVEIRRRYAGVTEG